ncbi:MAG: thioredoxin family protein [Bacteroidales bacterium]|nr:thioredoxin family protein [Bacteroidales bacterium]
MKKGAFFTVVMLIAVIASAQGYKPGDVVSDFRLKNIDGKMVSMSDYPEAKGFIIAFTCNECPYAIAYQDRIIDLDKKYKEEGFPVIAINPNDPAVEPRDSFEKMAERAREKGYTFPYLVDDGQTIYPKWGATNTPHMYVVIREGGDLKVVYTGTIDNNWRDASAVTVNYIDNAIAALKEGNSIEQPVTRAIGCSIKTK